MKRAKKKALCAHSTYIYPITTHKNITILIFISFVIVGKYLRIVMYAQSFCSSLNVSDCLRWCVGVCKCKNCKYVYWYIVDFSFDYPFFGVVVSAIVEWSFWTNFKSSSSSNSFFFSLFIDRATRQFIRQIKLRIENKTNKNKLRNNHMKLNK